MNFPRADSSFPAIGRPLIFSPPPTEAFAYRLPLLPFHTATQLQSLARRRGRRDRQIRQHVLASHQISAPLFEGDGRCSFIKQTKQ